MVVLVGCCYFFGSRTGCIISSVWLLLYYGLMAYFMHYQMINSRRAIIDLKTREYKKENTGFWVLGISFILMAFATVFLFIGAIMVNTY